VCAARRPTHPASPLVPPAVVVPYDGGSQAAAAPLVSHQVAAAAAAVRICGVRVAAAAAGALAAAVAGRHVQLQPLTLAPLPAHVLLSVRSGAAAQPVGPALLLLPCMRRRLRRLRRRRLRQALQVLKQPAHGRGRQLASSSSLGWRRTSLPPQPSCIPAAPRQGVAVGSAVATQACLHPPKL
jgi:hypothetical protein